MDSRNVATLDEHGVVTLPADWPAPDEHGVVTLPPEYMDPADAAKAVEDPDNKTMWDGRVPQFFVPVPWPTGAEVRRIEPQKVPDAEAGIENPAKEK
jgi:hypothetical protein